MHPNLRVRASDDLELTCGQAEAHRAGLGTIAAARHLEMRR